MELLSNKRLRPKESANDGRRTKGTFEYDFRTPIESDLGRVIFSPASRRLHDKTQVFPLTTDDNIHSRLTHSMEVMSLGRSFALFLSKYDRFCSLIGKEIDDSELLRDLEAVLSTVCLTHDIGNPPFGHFGETAIQSYFKQLLASVKTDLMEMNEGRPCRSMLMQHLFHGTTEEKSEVMIKELESLLADDNLLCDYIEFDGNAEGFRVLTKLQFLNDLYGMNLTSASLASYLKYPNVGSKVKSDEVSISFHKHGVFSTEKDRMTEALSNCNIPRLDERAFARHPLSFFMEAADSICYLCMDIEDAFSKGWINYADIAGAINKDENVVWRDILEKAEEHFEKEDPEIRKVVQLRTEIMAYLQRVACQNFKDNFDGILNGTYWKELIKEDKNGIAKALGKFCVSRIFTTREIESLEVTGNAVVRGIMDTYVDLLFNPEFDYRSRGKHLISETILKTVLQEHYDSKKEGKNACVEWQCFDVNDFTVEERFRLIRDYVAGMTDSYALSHYQMLSGQKL